MIIVRYADDVVAASSASRRKPVPRGDARAFAAFSLSLHPDKTA